MGYPLIIDEIFIYETGPYDNKECYIMYSTLYPVRGDVLGITIDTSEKVQTNHTQEISRARIDSNCSIEKQCVFYVQSKGIQISGNARDVEPNSQNPVHGCAVLLETPQGHVAYVEEVEQDRILISDQNWEKCGSISFRWIDRNDQGIRGFIK